jgi:hypothetical protein
VDEIRDTPEFTPGPWEIDDRSVMGCRSVFRGDDLIATVEDALSPANGRLIAAAPELYASLIELLEPLERASAELVAHGKAADENAEAAFDRARAALAKAAPTQRKV